MAAATGLHIYVLIQELRNVAFADPFELLGDDGKPRALVDMPKDARMAIEEYEAVTTTHSDSGVVTTRVRIKMRSKDKAIDKLMKYLGGYERNQQQPAQGYVVLATPDPRPPVADVPVFNGTPEEIARARNRADIERSNEWIIKHDLEDPIIIKGKARRSLRMVHVVCSHLDLVPVPSRCARLLDAGVEERQATKL